MTDPEYSQFDCSKTLKAIQKLHPCFRSQIRILGMKLFLGTDGDWTHQNFSTPGVRYARLFTPLPMDK